MANYSSVAPETLPANAPGPVRLRPKLEDHDEVSRFRHGMGSRMSYLFCLCCGNERDHAHRKDWYNCREPCWLCGTVHARRPTVCSKYSGMQTLSQWNRRTGLTKYLLESKQAQGAFFENIEFAPTNGSSEMTFSTSVKQVQGSENAGRRGSNHRGGGQRKSNTKTKDPLRVVQKSRIDRAGWRDNTKDKGKIQRGLDDFGDLLSNATTAMEVEALSEEKSRLKAARPR
ncbi:hypothetical protein DM02DRAFT_625282 [Periconia macrospinosa]|uniref:Uncharacterized protein n=1 Tax=Periconia macrospinosa TaxID=97972 RepID=A0A2V1E0X7_9PLEO|nr:hypothetical protein DM02DRAFT_625282 [Periconia macrospinosa]